MAEPVYKCIPIYGHIELRSWFELGPDGDLIGMGQSIHYDENKQTTKVVTEPTGLRLRYE